MDALLRSLTQHSAEISFVLVIAVLILTFVTARLSIRHAKQTNRWRDLLRDSSGDSLEMLLHSQLRERVVLESQITDLRQRVEELETQLAVSKRHLGLVRFDAFDDVGGNQSFALAVYDDKGNGAVLNSIIGRTQNRVYCKPLVNGRSERDLSQEEQRAIREAKASGPKSIVSP